MKFSSARGESFDAKAAHPTEEHFAFMTRYTGVGTKVQNHKWDPQRAVDVIHHPPARRRVDGGFLLILG